MKQESAVAYRSRFAKAVEAYSGFLANSNWKPPSFRSGGGSKRKRKEELSAVQAEGAAAAVNGNGHANGNGRPMMIDYPFPLRSGQVAHLRLPSQLEREDADRLGKFLDTLVIERRLELPAGETRKAA